MRGLRLFIRPIESGDAPAVTEFLTRHREPGIDQTPGAPATPAWGLLGKLLGDIVTVVDLEITTDALRVYDIVVAREFRRKRIGRAMLQEVEQLAARFDRQRIVVDDVRDAADFFRRVGFEREGEQWAKHW